MHALKLWAPRLLGLCRIPIRRAAVTLGSAAGLAVAGMGATESAGQHRADQIVSNPPVAIEPLAGRPAAASAIVGTLSAEAPTVTAAAGEVSLTFKIDYTKGQIYRAYPVNSHSYYM